MIGTSLLLRPGIFPRCGLRFSSPSIVTRCFADASSEHFDVVVVGAGLSGVGCACRISTECADKSLLIIERRQTMGGTWDLFRYPGIRSDSDMTSFGFEFKPWFSDKILARGSDIHNYVLETADEFDIRKKVRLGLKMTQVNWSSTDQLWHLKALHEQSGEIKKITSNFVLNCTGYYNYDQGYRPRFKGEEVFKGDIIHPQHWPKDYEYSGKRIVVIGSGATAITIVPSMADKAQHITMLQRSPGYIISMPDVDYVAQFMAKLMGENWAYRITRRRNIWIQRTLYKACMRWPDFMRRLLLLHVKNQIGGKADMKHFTPRYNPWEERLCAAPDGDFFEKIREGKASIVTDHIDHFTETGIRLASGKDIAADVIITATGLNMQMMGGIELTVDNKPSPLNEKMCYKSVMIEDVPNFAWIFGYVNAPWTLKCDIASKYVSRLIKHMDANEFVSVTPIDNANNKVNSGLPDGLNFNPSYVQRAQHMLPKQGNSGPWKLEQNYEKDKEVLLDHPLEDEYLTFSKQKK
eukprot:CAMPEP_0194372064 /NCGR_PEP_ID=MMETSP0174-20130528/20349_1 /TAXON_ID=216777 /ORGANISM="Proboscia alata, Strain PI-D3" /LENGTH=521 /DNA_ID=CAMNT_0039150341 /DNA_START=231 /DNA_END=1796 /DNA_ORIENTATION=+